MPIDMTMALINATLQVDQPQGEGRRLVATGFLVDAPKPDGTPRTVLITARHVFNDMAGANARLGYRFQGADGAWSMSAQPLAIRGEGSRPLWAGDEAHDIAAIAITAPPEFAKAAIPLAWLADEGSFQKAGLEPGDEMFALGYPGGLSSNLQGFPILRAGRVASFPLTPVAAYPTFLLDFRVFAGNSGGPVFITPDMRRHPGAAPADAPFVAGMLTKQSMENEGPISLGVVIQAVYIRRLIASLDQAPSATEAPAAQPAAALGAH